MGIITSWEVLTSFRESPHSHGLYTSLFSLGSANNVYVLCSLSRWQLPVKPGYMFLEKKNELFPVECCGVNSEIEKANSAQESRVCWRHI